jgi:hypothetical protein
MFEVHKIHLALSQHVRDVLATYITNDGVDRTENVNYVTSLKNLPKELFDYIHRRAMGHRHSDEKRPFLFNKLEYQRLQTAVSGFPIDETKPWRVDSDMPWCELSKEKYGELARSAAIEIRERMGERAANDWMESCHPRIRRLTTDPLHLDDGVGEIADWSKEICSYLRGFQQHSLLPRTAIDEQSSYPTPTTARLDDEAYHRSVVREFYRELKEIASSKGTNRNSMFGTKLREAVAECQSSREELSFLASHEHIGDYVARMRAGIATARQSNSTTSEDPSPNSLLRQMTDRLEEPGNRQLCKLSLRLLEALGEYSGHGQDKAR